MYTRPPEENCRDLSIDSQFMDQQISVDVHGRIFAAVQMTREAMRRKNIPSFAPEIDYKNVFGASTNLTQKYPSVLLEESLVEKFV